MIIHSSVQDQVFRCPRCGNREFPDGILRPSFICPVIGCGCVIEPDRMPPVLPDPDRAPVAQADQPRTVPGDPLIYDRDENGDWTVRGVYGDPTVLTIPTMVSGRPVMSIGSNAFAGRKTLRRVTLPDTVSVIGEDAFAGCSELESITFGTGLTLLDRGCLRGCSALFAVTLPDRLEEIGREAFSECERLESVRIGGNVRVIRDNAFYMCTSLLDFTFTRRPEHIAVTAFAGCYAFDETALFPGEA
ncbi:MAG: leucine-rich repeat domain-containing protein [Aristaeellaceae bacterium]